MSNIKITEDGFVWLLVTDKAKEIFIGGLFELYILYSDDSESKIEGFGQLVDALENGFDIGVEVGHPDNVKEEKPTVETQLELQDEIVKKTGINIVTCGNCSSVLLHRTGVDYITCPDCGFESDICDFPDLNYQ
jgi:hypothetical protein